MNNQGIELSFYASLFCSLMWLTIGMLRTLGHLGIIGKEAECVGLVMTDVLTKVGLTYTIFRCMVNQRVHIKNQVRDFIAC